MNKLKEFALIAALLAISAAPRLPGIGRFTSIDEPFWLRQSANFYYALGQRDFERTLYEYHPAVTTMWIIAAGMLLYFPEYRALQQGYLKPGKVDLFLAEHGKEPLQLLIVSRLVQVAVVLVLILAVYLLLRRLFGTRTAFFTTLLISLGPFLMGQSRLLNHEAMVGLFSLVSLLALFAYLYRDRRFMYLLVSASSAALAQLTKSSAAPIIVLAAIMLGAHVLTGNKNPLSARLLGAARILALWIALLAGSYFALWPGMWVAPGMMLRDVYGNAISYTLQGARVSVLPDAASSGMTVASVAKGIGIYLNDLLWRNTPITGLGFLVGTVLAIRALKRREDPLYVWLVLFAILLAGAFVLLFGIQRGPKPPHYLLTSYVCLDLIAGLGLMRGWELLARRFPGLAGGRPTWAALSVVLVLQLLSAAAFYPYYISYYDPVIEALQPGIHNPTLNENGYGMGLDQAAALLADKPDAKAMVVISAHGLGSFSYYFPGTTIPMNDLDMSDPLIAGILPDADYVVVDYFNQTRKNIAQDLVGHEPEQRIWLNHIEFLHIYRATDFLETGP